MQPTASNARAQRPWLSRGWFALFGVVLVAHAAATHFAGVAIAYRLSITGNLDHPGDYLLAEIFSLLILPICGPLLSTGWFVEGWDFVPLLLNSAVWAAATCLGVRWIRASLKTPMATQRDG